VTKKEKSFEIFTLVFYRERREGKRESFNGFSFENVFCRFFFFLLVLELFAPPVHFSHVHSDFIGCATQIPNWVLGWEM